MTPELTTFTHRKVNPLHILPLDVCREDVAHHLALINRFNGATKRPITVAQHAVYVSRLCEGTGLEWAALHHDDGEAYVGDMTKWLKEAPEMKAFRDAEDQAQQSCYEAFDVDPNHWYDRPHLMHPIVIDADRLMVRWEAQWSGITIGHAAYGVTTAEERERIGAWQPWSWRVAEEAYLTRFRLLLDRGFGARYTPPPAALAAPSRTSDRRRALGVGPGYGPQDGPQKALALPVKLG